MKIFKDWLQISKIVFLIIFSFMVTVAVIVAFAVGVDKWTNQMEFGQGLIVMIICFAVLFLILLGCLITTGSMIIKLVRIGVKDLYEKHPEETKEGAETIYELIKKIKNKRKQISLALTIFLIFLDVVPPLKKIFKKYLRRLWKEVALA